MAPKYRLVIDTNLFISSAITQDGTSAEAYRHAVRNAILLFSNDTLSELDEVMQRAKFDAYVSRKK